MFTPANLFLYFIIFCISAAIGAFVERILKGRSAPLPPLPAPDKKPLAGDGDVEVLSAWRTRSHTVWLEMDGRRLDNKDSLLPEQRQRLLSLVLDLRPWLETARPAAAAPVAAPQPAQPGKKTGASAVEEVKPAPVLDSIIQQIDKVLQAGLETSPFKDRGIQLIEGPGGIVIVKDGANRYEGLEAIPDPAIKALIRQAVADWEKGVR